MPIGADPSGIVLLGADLSWIVLILTTLPLRALIPIGLCCFGADPSGIVLLGADPSWIVLIPTMLPLPALIPMGLCCFGADLSGIALYTETHLFLALIPLGLCWLRQNDINPALALYVHFAMTVSYMNPRSLTLKLSHAAAHRASMSPRQRPTQRILCH